MLKGPPAKPSLAAKVRANGQIRAAEVRVIDEHGRQIGALPLADALTLARSRGVDLVEIAPHAKPPVCRLVDLGKFRDEAAKRRRKKS